MFGVFAAPVFEDREKSLRARNLFWLVWVVLITLTLSFAGRVAVQPQILSSGIRSAVILMALSYVVLDLNRRGQIILASWVLIAGYLASITRGAIAGGGIHYPGVAMFYIYAIAASLLLGFRAGVITAILCSLIGLGLTVAGYFKLIPPFTTPYSDAYYWLMYSYYLALTIFLLRMVTDSLKSAFDREKAELAGRLRLKDQLETLIGQAPIGVLVHQDFRAVKVNAELLTMFGLSQEEELKARDVRQFISEESVLVGSSARDRRRDPDIDTVMDARCRRNDGKWIDCEIQAFPIQWEGKPSVCAMITDVTHKKRLEAQLRQAQRLEAVGQMTGGVAHDFNNLLTVILGNAEVMEKRLKDDAAMAELAALTRQAAEQGAELTGRLLAFSRQQTLSVKSTDIGALADGMSNFIRRVLDENIELRSIAEPSLWKASADVAQLQSALLNLIFNARDAMPRGGILTVETANVRLGEADFAGGGWVTQAGFGTGDYVMLAVSDTGIGMDEKTRLRAFEPFFTTKDVGKGSGLGLSMVYGVVSQLGGHIRIRSEPGCGTTIGLYLPRATEQEEAQAAQDAVLAAGRNEMILLVEDHELVRPQVEAQLKSLGYRVVSARDGVEALKMLKATADFDLLFTNMAMPRGMSGHDLARESSVIRPGLPVLFTSGYADNAVAHQSRLDPSVNLLTKPYRLAVLAAKLRHALDSARGERSDMG